MVLRLSPRLLAAHRVQKKSELDLPPLRFTLIHSEDHQSILASFASRYRSQYSSDQKPLRLVDVFEMGQFFQVEPRTVAYAAHQSDKLGLKARI